jgi:hypothetical protein
VRSLAVVAGVLLAPSLAAAQSCSASISMIFAVQPRQIVVISDVVYR